MKMFLIGLLLEITKTNLVSFRYQSADMSMKSMCGNTGCHKVMVKMTENVKLFGSNLKQIHFMKHTQSQHKKKCNRVYAY